MLKLSKKILTRVVDGRWFVSEVKLTIVELIGGTSSLITDIIPLSGLNDTTLVIFGRKLDASFLSCTNNPLESLTLSVQLFAKVKLG